MWTWDIAPWARKEFLSLPAAAQEALVALMEGIIADDPLGIRREAAETDPGGVVRDLAFGNGGLVSVLIVVRGQHAEVVQITWAGEG